MYDLPAQEKFQQMVWNQLEDAEAVILAYDITRRPTFQALETYVEQVNKYNVYKKLHDCTMVLIGNKSDK